MLIGFLFKALPHADAFFYLGVGVFSIGVVVLAFRLVMKTKLKATDNAVPVLATVK
jgi:hypothetical protein